jgi:protein-L-isoaspartate O-methyltransferase
MNPEAYEVMARTEEEHWWFVGRRRILASIIRGLKLGPSAQILEVGAGTGGNLAMPINAAFLAIFSSEARLLRLGDLPFGVSLLGILASA